MGTRTSLNGYPLHPVLAGFPIVFYLSTFISLCIFYSSGNMLWFTISYFTGIACIATGLLAALPGFIDWLNLPSGKKMRPWLMQQFFCNVLSFSLLCIHLYFQNDMIYNEVPAAQPGITLSAAGVLLIMLSLFIGRKQDRANSSFSFSSEKQQLETSN